MAVRLGLSSTGAYHWLQRQEILAKVESRIYRVQRGNGPRPARFWRPIRKEVNNVAKKCRKRGK